MTIDPKAALRDLLAEYDRNTCTHEETHRGGCLWTICDSCGRRWADDEGGFKPHVDSPAVAAAREVLADKPLRKYTVTVTYRPIEFYRTPEDVREIWRILGDDDPQ
jgi:hypothetical protein